MTSEMFPSPDRSTSNDSFSVAGFLSFMAGIHKFSRNLGATLKVEAFEELHEAGFIPRNHKC